MGNAFSRQKKAEKDSKDIKADVKKLLEGIDEEEYQRRKNQRDRNDYILATIAGAHFASSVALITTSTGSIPICFAAGVSALTSVGTLGMTKKTLAFGTGMITTSPLWFVVATKSTSPWGLLGVVIAGTSGNLANIVGRKLLSDDALDQEALSDNEALIRRVMRWGVKEKWWWAGAYSCLVCNSILSATLPSLFTNVVKNVASASSSDFAFAICRLSGVSMTVAAMSIIQAVLFSEASFRMNIKLKRKAINAVLKQDMGFFDSTSTGDILTQIGSVGSVSGVLSSMVPQFVKGTLTTTTTFFILSYIDFKLAAITLISVPFEVCMSYVYSKNFEKYSEKVQEVNARSSTVIQETMSNIHSIRPLHAEEKQRDKYLNTLRELRRLQIRNRMLLARQTALSTIIPNITGVVILSYGSYLTMQGIIDMTSLVTVTMYQMALVGSIGSIMSIYVDYGRMLGSTKKFFKTIDRDPEQMTRGNYVPEDKQLKGHIKFDNITFSYPSAKNKVILSNFSLEINPGEVVAFVGRSGSGKSTIINLIGGLYDPTEGTMVLDGKPVWEYCPEFLYEHGMAIVQQTPQLFRGTVYENIVFGLPPGRVTKEEVENAAQMANAHNFIMQLPNQYETDLGSNGSKLSGGQKQRIAIARALVRNPSILLLDEATSALDVQSEQLVKEALDRLLKGRTVILVAHRLSTIRNADRILVINGGEIAEEGTHEELVEVGGMYAQFANIQQKNVSHMRTMQTEGKKFHDKADAHQAGLKAVTSDDAGNETPKEEEKEKQQGNNKDKDSTTEKGASEKEDTTDKKKEGEDQQEEKKPEEVEEQKDTNPAKPPEEDKVVDNSQLDVPAARAKFSGDSDKNEEKVKTSD